MVFSRFHAFEHNNPVHHEVAASYRPPDSRRSLLPLIIAILLALSMPAFSQQTMMMTYELQVVCENLPGSSVTITAEAQGDLYGPTGTLLDPDDPANHPFFMNNSEISFDDDRNNVDVAIIDRTLAPWEVGVLGIRIDYTYKDEDGNRVHEMYCKKHDTRICYYINIMDNGTTTAVTGYWEDGTVIFQDEGSHVEHETHETYGVVTVTPGD
ncbi:MAG: hypothetical protein KFH87_00195 [Bacteroidetes bacterium]|nr:hypothetical protein [Bacteroidota bacterium]